MKFFTVPAFFLLFVFGFVSGIIFFRVPNLPKDFFTLRLIEVLNLLTPLFVALLIAAYVNSKVNLGIKKREALGQLLDRAQQSLEQIFGRVQDYIDSPTTNDARKIIRSIKHFSIIADLVEKGIEKDSDLECGAQIVGFFHRFKKSVTDNPFNTHSAQFSPQRLDEIDAAYGKMCALIHEYKMKVYS